MYAADWGHITPEKPRGRQQWGSPLAEPSTLVPVSKELQEVPEFPRLWSSKEHEEKDMFSTSKEEEAVAPNWLRGGINTSSGKRVLTDGNEEVSMSRQSASSKSWGLASPGTDLDAINDQLGSGKSQKTWGLGSPGTNLGPTKELCCPQLVALAVPPQLESDGSCNGNEDCPTDNRDGKEKALL
eukprot:4442189-Karenia_brevis.AAC.1